MNMKGKPSTKQFKSSEDDFLSGGAADKADKKKPVTADRVQKVFRLPPDLVEGLKDEAYKRSKKEGRRVTENELVEAAIKRYLAI